MMAIVAMTDASAGGVASSAEYNKVTANVRDLDARLGAVVSTSTAHARLTALEGTVNAGGTGNAALNTRLATVETLTTDTTTNGGQGNVQLANRLGTGVGTGTNVTTGSASSQLADLRSRATTLEGTVNAAGTGNAALGTRVTALEASSGTSPLVRVTRFSAASLATTQNAYTYIPWTAAPRNSNTIWSAGNPTRLTVPAGLGGLWNIEGILLILPGTSGAANTNKAVGIRVNGVGTVFRAGAPNLGVAANYVEMTLQMHMELTAGDYIEIGVWHNFSPATDITLGSDAGAPWVVMRKIA